MITYRLLENLATPTGKIPLTNRAAASTRLLASNQD